MLEQVSNAIKFYAFFTNAGEGATGLTVTVDVYNPAGTEVVSAGSATAMGDGVYYYSLASGSTGSEGEYIAIFKTTGTVDQKHIPALWVLGKAGIEHLDADVADCATATALQAVDDNVDAIKLKTDLIPPDPAETSDLALLATSAEITALNDISASDVWAAATRTLTDKTDYALSTAERAAIAAAVWAATTRTLSAFGFTVTTDSASREASKADVSALATSAEITALNDISASDVWAAATRTLTDKTDYALSTAERAAIAAAVWAATTRTLSAFGFTVTTDSASREASKADVSGLATASALATVDGIVDAILADTAELQTNQGDWATADVSGLSTLTAQQVWEYVTRTLTGSVTVGNPNDCKADVSGLATSAEITALNDISASDVWAAATRTLTDKLNYGLSTAERAAIAAAVWAATTRTLSAFGFTVTTDSASREASKADVSALATASALATVDGIVDAILADTAELQTNQGNWATADVSGLSTLTAQQVWEYVTRTLTSAGASGATAEEVWAYVTRTLTGAVTVGNPNDCKADVSGLALETTAQAVKAKTDNLPDDPASETDATANTAAIVSELEAMGGTVQYIYNNTTVLLGGDGNLLLTIQLYRTGTVTPIADALLAVYYGETMKASGQTGLDGTLAFALDEGGPYEVRGRKDGFLFTVYTETYLGNDKTVTLYATPAVISTPSDPGVVRVYDYLRDTVYSRKPETVNAEARIMNLPHNSAGAIYSAPEVSPVYDKSTGLLYWDIVGGATVNFRIRGGFEVNKTVVLPISGMVRLYDLISV